MPISPALLSSNTTINDISVCLHRDRVRYLTAKPPKDKTQINHTLQAYTHVAHTHTHTQREKPPGQETN